MIQSADIPVLLDADTIQRKVSELGEAITRDYAGKPLTLLVILKGSFVFAADLARAISLPVHIDFMGLRSYGDSTTTDGVVQITHDLSKPIQDRDVLVVEDIVDTGLTMAYLLDNLKTRKPQSVRLASLLHKPSRCRVEVPIDYLGFTIDDVFVVGYGLDYAQQHRNLPYLGTLPPL